MVLHTSPPQKSRLLLLIGICLQKLSCVIRLTKIQDVYWIVFQFFQITSSKQTTTKSPVQLRGSEPYFLYQIRCTALNFKKPPVYNPVFIHLCSSGVNVRDQLCTTQGEKASLLASCIFNWPGRFGPLKQVL